MHAVKCGVFRGINPHQPSSHIPQKVLYAYYCDNGENPDSSTAVHLFSCAWSWLWFVAKRTYEPPTMNSDDGDSDNEINNVDDYDVCNRHKKTIRMVEFFSGIGGMRLAVTNALKQQQRQEQDSMSLELCQAYDISLYANETYKHNFNGDVAKTKLVEQLTVKQLDEMNANLWTMSPPCQPFTRTRDSKQLDLEDKRCNGLKSLMLEKLPKLSIKPKWIVLENVKGFATSHMLEVVKQSLHNCGYTYQQYLVSPIHFGIPNHRQRYYLLCERSNRFRAEEETICTTIPSSLPPPLHRRKISEYLTSSHNDNLINDNTDEESNSYMIPKPVLEKPWAKHLSIVTCHDDETYCFTAGYGRIYHKSTGSFLLVTQEQEQQEDVASISANTITSKDLDRTDMTQYYGSLRRFTPRELLTLFGFIDTSMPSTKAPTSTTARNSAPQQPEQEFHFPPTINLEHQYKLIGNSINVTVVTELLKELLSSSDVVEREEQINHQQQMLEQVPSLWSAPMHSTSPQCQTVREERSSPQPQPEQQSTVR